nr:cytochrome P450 704C1-like [Tanacetum cinerariifolium]
MKKYHPTVGTMFDLFMNLDRLHHYMTDLAEKYKTYRLISLFHGEVHTSDPANAEYILKTNFTNYGKGKHNHNVMGDLLGEGIFAVDGEKWRQQRKVASNEFSTKVLRDFSIGFGIDLDNLSGPSGEGVRFSRAFDDANTLVFRRFVDMSWKMKKFLNIGSEAELKKNMKVIDEFIYKVIQIKIHQMHNLKDEFLYNRDDVLSRFVQINDRDPKYLRDIILNFVLAGKDPIAITMCWFIYMLCKHPQVQHEVAKEIKEATNNTLEEVANVADFAARLSDAALEKMQYLHAALTETIRLYPALPVDPKICFPDDVLPDGCNVKKGDVVAYMPYAMGKMKLIWGDDAHEFKPRRWLHHNGHFRPENPFKFTAFQDPKICFPDDVLPDGCNVKKGDVVAYMPYAMGKMKFIWGDDAHEFKPRRWLHHNGRFRPENPFKFTAFQ